MRKEAESKEAFMAYGTAMEPHAVYTLVRIALPSLSLFNGLSYMEEGRFCFRPEILQVFVESMKCL